MLKIIEKETKKKLKIIKMCEMLPLQVGRITKSHNYDNHIVMRTASSEKFEVMNLTEPGQDSCWLNYNCITNNIEIELLEEPIIIEIYNE
jgi:hypothetical protein